MKKLKMIALIAVIPLALLKPYNFARTSEHIKIEGAECKGCHEDLVNKKKVHPPAAEDCTTCHEYSEEDEMAQVKLAIEGNDLCLTCHTERQEEMEAKKFVHAPIKDLGCKVCHTPHSSDFPRLLKANLNQVCLACHKWDVKHEKNVAGDLIILPDTAIPADYPNKAKKVIVDRNSIGHPYLGHPTGGVPDPSQKGKDLSCVSCHDAHAGNFAQMFKKDLRGQALCDACHLDR